MKSSGAEDKKKSEKDGLEFSRTNAKASTPTNQEISSELGKSAKKFSRMLRNNFPLQLRKQSKESETSYYLKQPKALHRSETSRQTLFFLAIQVYNTLNDLLFLWFFTFLCQS